jgi:arabinan endo-1,5-alpha-L-arabinosidase
MTDVIGGQSGTVVGKLAYAPGAIGKGFFFDGSQSGIMFPDGDQFKIGGSLSMVAWINLASYPSFSSQILFRGDNRIGLDPYFLNVVPPNEVRITIEQDYKTGETVGFPCPLNQFVHVVGVFDAEKGALRIYKNGRLAASKPTSVKVMKDLDARAEPGLGIGNIQRPAFSNQPFHGIIDEVQLYNRALTDSEIEALYNRR